MHCSRTFALVYAALLLTTAGFVLTLSSWFAPPINHFVYVVRRLGPCALVAGFLLLACSCLTCAADQGRCCELCYVLFGRHVRFSFLRSLRRPPPGRPPPARMRGPHVKQQLQQPAEQRTEHCEQEAELPVRPKTKSPLVRSKNKHHFGLKHTSLTELSPCRNANRYKKLGNENECSEALLQNVTVHCGEANNAEAKSTQSCNFKRNMQNTGKGLNKVKAAQLEKTLRDEQLSLCHQHKHSHTYNSESCVAQHTGGVAVDDPQRASPQIPPRHHPQLSSQPLHVRPPQGQGSSDSCTAGYAETAPSAPSEHRRQSLPLLYACAGELLGDLRSTNI